jgi:tRNA 2-thiouridine synthesizing protein A
MSRVFDARGMKCPLPVLKARRLIREMTPGEILEVQATDPGAPADFEHFCQTAGHRLLSVDRTEAEIVIRIETGALPS